jgi:hypothetical protein
MYRAKQVLIITTSNTRPGLVIVQVAEPEAIAAALRA